MKGMGVACYGVTYCPGLGGAVDGVTGETGGFFLHARCDFF